MAMRQEVNAPLILTVGAVGGVMVLVLMIGLHAWYLNEERREQVAKTAGDPPELVRVARTQPSDQKLMEAMQRVVSSGGKLPATRPATQPAARPATRPNAAPATRPVAN